MGPLVCSWSEQIDDDDDVMGMNYSQPTVFMEGDGDDDDDDGGYDYAPAA